ncbi:MAG TPA: ribosome maturation factor RimM [Stellaceae bacterium]|nr:ribosome maturation factor RimM [Stellaceae bacterium]
MGAGEERVLMGVVTGAHGVRGLVRVKSFAAHPEDIAAYGPLEDEAGKRRFTVEPVGTGKGVVIARLPGIADRDAAEGLKGTRLYVRREALPQPGEEEYYHADLIGLEVWLEGGEAPFGRVTAVNDYGGGDHLEIERADGKAVLVPFTRSAVPVVDIVQRKIMLSPPLGLFDSGTEEGEAQG